MIKSFKFDSDWEYIKKIIKRSIEDPIAYEYSKCRFCNIIIEKRKICCVICRLIQGADCFYANLKQSAGIHTCSNCGYTFNRNSGNIDENTWSIIRKTDSDSDYDYDDYDSDYEVPFASDCRSYSDSDGCCGYYSDTYSPSDLWDADY